MKRYVGHVEDRRKQIVEKRDLAMREYAKVQRGIQNKEDEVGRLRACLNEIKVAERKRRDNMVKTEREIRDLTKQLQDEPDDSELGAIKTRQDEVTRRLRDISSSIKEIIDKNKNVVDQIEKNMQDRRRIKEAWVTFTISWYFLTNDSQHRRT